MERNSCASTKSETSTRKRQRVQRKWSVAEEEGILHNLRKTVLSGNLIEKPSADAYYEGMLRQLDFANCNAVQLKNKAKNMKHTYMETIFWRSQAGQRVRESEGEEAFERMTLERCPNFKLLTEVYGTRPKVDPTHTVVNPSHTVVNPSRTVVSKPPAQSVVLEDCDIPELVIQDVRTLSAELLELSSCCSSLEEAESTKPDPQLLRGQKIALDSRRLDLDCLKFEFEKRKWEKEMDLRQQEVKLKLQEVELRQQELALESKRIENGYLLSRYELELKYKSKTILNKADVES